MHGGKLHRAPATSTRTSGGTSPPATTSSARSSPRSTVSSWCSTRTPTPTSTPRPGWSGSCSTPTPRTSTCAWTPGTSRTATATTSPSSSRLPGADPVRAPQVGRSRGAAAGPRREPLVGRGRAARRHVRAAVRRARVPPLLDALAALRRRPLHRRRAGPVPGRRRTSRCRSPPAPRATSAAVASARYVAGPTDPEFTPTRGTLDDEYPQVLAWSSRRCSRPRHRRRLQQSGRRHRASPARPAAGAAAPSPAARTTRSR